MRKILVTGANGQLGWELGQMAASYPQYQFIFTDRTVIDLAKPETLATIINNIAPDAIINTAAYTAVDKAESEKELALAVNAKSVEQLAIIAAAKKIPFLTFSTDYVFTGNATTPYSADTPLAPLNFYGFTKAEGERMAIAANPNTIIIRTSWVFSTHGNNFVKSMIRFMKERDVLNIVSDQRGRPTYARDLADATMKMIIALDNGQAIKGIYHYANKGETTWYDYCKKIQSIVGLSCQVNSILTVDFPTPAKRPSYSVLATDKIEKELSLTIPLWETSLLECINKLS